MTVHEHTPAKRGLSLFVPHYLAASVRDIDFPALHTRGIRCVAVDIDDTLVPHDGMALDPKTIAFFREMRDAGHIETLALATNRPERKIGDLANQMHADLIVYARGLHRKPFQSFYRGLLHSLGCEASEAVMIGDKVIQDVYGANAAGMTSILVDPIGPGLWFERMLARRVRDKAERFSSTKI